MQMNKFFLSPAFFCLSIFVATSACAEPSAQILESSNIYDHQGRRVRQVIGAKIIDYNWANDRCVSQTVTENGEAKTTLFYHGADIAGGGTGGLLYSETAEEGVNYKHYNLRGDVVMTSDSNKAVVSSHIYDAFGGRKDFGKTDSLIFTSNTKIEDNNALLNEGYRFRSLDFATFLTPDPMEHIDGLNQYAYVNQNPWSKYDPIGLAEQELRARTVNSVLIGGILGYRHSSRVIRLTPDEYREIAPVLSKIQRFILDKSFRETGEYKIIASFFRQDIPLPDGGTREILQLEYNDDSDTEDKTEFSARIIPRTPLQDPTGIRLAREVFEALKYYERNEQNVLYAPLRTGEHQGNCNSGQNTLSETASGRFDSTVHMQRGLKNIHERFSQIHFTNQ